MARPCGSYWVATFRCQSTWRPDREATTTTRKMEEDEDEGVTAEDVMGERTQAEDNSQKGQSRDMIQ